MKNLAIFIFFLFITACQNANENIQTTFPRDQDLVRNMRAGSMINNGKGIVFGGGSISSSTDIWKNAMETISEELPILVADRESGVISTDWGVIDGGKYKINVIVKKDDVVVKAISRDGLNDEPMAERIKRKILQE